MILVCENCKSTFLVPASYFVSGPRQVRCGKCKHVWVADNPKKTAHHEAHQHAPKPHEQPEAQAQIVREVEVEKPPKPPRPPIDWHRMARLALASLAGSIGAAGIMGLLMVLLHGPIIRQWPVLQQYYIALGLAKPPEQDRLYLIDIRSVRRYQDGAMHLIVEGSIRSGAQKTQVIPELAVEALGPDGRVIQSWRITPPQATVRPGMTVPFSSAILSPEGTVSEVNLSFVEQPRDDEH